LGVAYTPQVGVDFMIKEVQAQNVMITDTLLLELTMM